MRNILTSIAGASVILSVCFLIGCTSGPSAVQTRPTPKAFPGLNLSLDELRAEYQHLYAGKRLKPKKWPNGARVAVALSFEMDNSTTTLARGTPGSEPMTRGQYGAIDGLPRILRVLDKENMPASFFIPAVSAALNPEMIPAIQSKGRHEIGIHGWIHENLVELNDEAKEQELLNKSIELLTKAMGKKPVGYRAPSWAMSAYTMKQVKDAGFLYDSSLMSSDDAYDISMDGKSTGVVELPIERILDDAPYFGAANGSLPSPELVDRIYRDEFDVAYQEGGLFVLTMHPFYTGHRSRALWLDKLIAYMKSKPGVWFATHEDVARYVKTAPAVD
ncbi:MAG TPA: polysaccharide deacetylase [Bryobacterales bacterium]|nr:polysaccharide deacetylase [Bryobacterales bacterium]